MVKYGTPPDWFTLISEGFGPPVQAGQLLTALDAVGLGDDAPLAIAAGIEGLLAVMKFPHIADKDMLVLKNGEQTLQGKWI